jgi:hypothetical protein
MHYVLSCNVVSTAISICRVCTGWLQNYYLNSTALSIHRSPLRSQQRYLPTAAATVHIFQSALCLHIDGYCCTTSKSRHTTLGRTPLEEGSTLRTDLYLTTHNTPCTWGGFETAIPASERPQTYALRHAATCNSNERRSATYQLWAGVADSVPDHPTGTQRAV